MLVRRLKQFRCAPAGLNADRLQPRRLQYPASTALGGSAAFHVGRAYRPGQRHQHDQ